MRESIISNRYVQLLIAGAACAEDHPLRAVRVMTTRFWNQCRFVRRHVCRVRSAIDCAGEVVAGTVIANAVLVRSERLLMEEIDYSILFRWFVA